MDLDYDHENPDDEFYFLLSEIEPEEDLVEYYCVQSDFVACEVGEQKFKVHIRCWADFRFREEVIVKTYCSQKKHLCVNAPFSGCAHCGLNIHYIELSPRCDTCCLLQNV